MAGVESVDLRVNFRGNILVGPGAVTSDMSDAQSVRYHGAHESGVPLMEGCAQRRSLLTNAKMGNSSAY